MNTSILVQGLSFAEGPRWHQGKLWFSDFYTNTVYCMDEHGEMEAVVEVPGHPSGLGWLPNGDLLVVSMKNKQVLRYDGSELHLHADLSAFVAGDCNDMVVDVNGDAWVGNFGFDIYAEEAKPTCLLRVMHTGEVEVAADGLMFPNGSVISADGRSLIVAETMAARLSAYAVEADGRLGERYTWALTGDYMPDGISMDSAGGIWVAAPMSKQIIRVEEGGLISHRIDLEQDSYACAVGGKTGQSLFICTSAHTVPSECEAQRSGRIELLDLSAI
ncbi:MAG: SMP-30/gluconolactonase/LRE family protein [Pseudomonadales bacterium]